MCCSGKNITDRRLHFISNALSQATAVLFKLMKVQQREKEEVEQEFTGSLGTNCYFSAIYLVKEALYCIDFEQYTTQLEKHPALLLEKLCPV